MEEVYLKVKIPTKYYNKIKQLRSAYDVPVESIEESIRYATQHRLKGLNGGIKVELYSNEEQADKWTTPEAKQIADNIHKNREEEKVGG